MHWIPNQRLNKLMVNVCSYQRIEYIEIDVVPLRYTQSQLEISMGMMDHGDRVLITADPAYRDRYCATEIYSVPIRCLKGVAAKSRSYQPPSQIFHDIKSREKSQISSHLNPSSQWSCSNTVIISATSSNFPNTSPERCSVRKHSTVSTGWQQPRAHISPLIKFPKHKPREMKGNRTRNLSG